MALSTSVWSAISYNTIVYCTIFLVFLLTAQTGHKAKSLHGVSLDEAIPY